MKKTRLQKMVKIIACSITWREAEACEKVYPGFLAAYTAAQDEWERDPKNRVLITNRQARTITISKRLQTTDIQQGGVR